MRAYLLYYISLVVGVYVCQYFNLKTFVSTNGSRASIAIGRAISLSCDELALGLKYCCKVIRSKIVSKIVIELEALHGEYIPEFEDF